MGSVFRAERLHIGDEVAVKLLHRDLVREQQALERFRREARTAAMIRHPNVVTIHDFSDGTGAGKRSIHRDGVGAGCVSRQLASREGRMPAERAVRLMQDICAGVGVAHRQGLLHRDLKPDNVIVVPPTHEGDEETAKVVDFGLAKVRDVTAQTGLTQTGAVLGTLYYMSPEQCSGEELDARADVYSLGAMLYEMLIGDPPFRANNLAGLISNTCTSRRRIFRSFSRSLPRSSLFACRRLPRIPINGSRCYRLWSRSAKGFGGAGRFQPSASVSDTTFAVELDRGGSGRIRRADCHRRGWYCDSVCNESRAERVVKVAVQRQIRTPHHRRPTV